MNHLRALDADLEPVDVNQGEYHNGPQCAVCQTTECAHCGGFDTEECPGVDLTDDHGEWFAMLTEQVHRHAARADRMRADLTTERNLRLLAERAAKRHETAWANAQRGHALAEADAANALYREKLALAEVAKLNAELTELRNTEPA